MVEAKKVFSDGSGFDLFAGFRVKDYTSAVAWYEQLLGCSPAFLPNDVEAVWELGEHRYLFIEVVAEQAGHSRHLIFLKDLDAFISQIEARGLNPAKRETLSNGVRKVVFIDPDGNEVEFGGSPANS